jgi:hypothetical protein
LKPKIFPFEYLNRKYEKFIDTRIIESNFEDFDINHINIQIKIIYEDLRDALEKKEIPFLLRSLHKEIFKIDENKILLQETYLNLEKIRKNFSNKSNNWRMIDLKIYNSNDYIKDEDKNKDKRYCLALFKYFSEDFNKNMQVIFIRDLDKTKSFYDWKMLDYDYLDNNNLDDNIFSVNNDIKI